MKDSFGSESEMAGSWLEAQAAAAAAGSASAAACVSHAESAGTVAATGSDPPGQFLAPSLGPSLAPPAWPGSLAAPLCQYWKPLWSVAFEMGLPWLVYARQTRLTDSREVGFFRHQV